MKCHTADSIRIRFKRKRPIRRSLVCTSYSHMSVCLSVSVKSRRSIAFSCNFVLWRCWLLLDVSPVGRFPERRVRFSRIFSDATFCCQYCSNLLLLHKIISATSPERRWCFWDAPCSDLVQFVDSKWNPGRRTNRLHRTHAVNVFWHLYVWFSRATLRLRGSVCLVWWPILQADPGSTACVFYRAMLCIRGTSHGPVSVSLSVRPSVTSQCSTKMAKRRITQTTPHDTPGNLVSWRQRSPRNSTGVTPYEGAECR